MKNKYIRLTIRINTDLHHMLTSASKAGNRSLNSEIARRIDSSFQKKNGSNEMPEAVSQAIENINQKIRELESLVKKKGTLSSNLDSPQKNTGLLEKNTGLLSGAMNREKY